MTICSFSRYTITMVYTNWWFNRNIHKALEQISSEMYFGHFRPTHIKEKWKTYPKHPFSYHIFLIFQSIFCLLQKDRRLSWAFQWRLLGLYVVQPVLPTINTPIWIPIERKNQFINSGSCIDWISVVIYRYAIPNSNQNHHEDLLMRQYIEMYPCWWHQWPDTQH